jgi:hypothetical protein
MKLVRPILLLALALVLVACGGAPASTSPSFSENIQPADAGAAAPLPPGEATALESGGGAMPAAEPQQQAQQQFERLVIKTANLSLQVDSARDAETNVRGIVSKLGGYVVKVESTGADEYLSSTIVFRVPAERFDEALSGVQGLAKKVLGRTVSGDDVTEEFVDLSSRLKNLEATRDRLLVFLDKASTVEEALTVNQSLSQVQGEIEQIKGRQQFLRQSAALSTITVSLAPVPPPAPIVAEDSWQPVAVAREALRGLVGFGQGLANVAIVALVWVPVWLPLALVLVWLRRRVLRARPVKHAVQAAE